MVAGGDSAAGFLKDNSIYVNPAQGNGPLNTMTTDPNVKTEEVKEQPADAVAPEQATEESAEEGTTEG